MTRTVSPGSKPSQGVKVEYKGRSRDWKIMEVLGASQLLDVQVSETSRGGPIRGGCEYLVTVSLKALPAAGPIAEQVTLKTNDPNNPLIQLSVTGSVASQLALAPDRLRIDGVAIGQSASTQVLVRAAKPFPECMRENTESASATVRSSCTYSESLPTSRPRVPSGEESMRTVESRLFSVEII